MDSLITLVCLIGIISALITIFLNIKLVIKNFKHKSKSEDMKFFYYRFSLDVFFGICLSSYILYILSSIRAPEIMDKYRSLIVFLALPWSNLAAARSLIALSISIERILAAFFPMKYRARRNRFPNWVVLIVSSSFGVFENFVLFQLCSYNMEIPPSCRVFGCAVNRCFYSYWLLYRTIIFSTIVILSLLLSVKLFIWNKLKQYKTNSKLSRANRLALLDTVTVLTFDFLPAFCGNLWPAIFSFDLIGPYNAMGKLIGCAIEAVVVCSVLKTKKTHDVNPRSQITKRVLESTRSMN